MQMFSTFASRFRICALAVSAVLSYTVALGAVQAQQQPAGRTLAPGVLTTIPPDVDKADAMHIHDILAIRADEQLQWTPNTIPQSKTLFAMAENVPFLQTIWCLEFSFKPFRMIEVDVPQPSGGARRKLIWYMVYRVRNVGAGIKGELKPDGEYVAVDAATDNIRFFPEFVLTSQDRSAEGERANQEYLDRVVPAAMQQIRRRERISSQLFNSIEMPQQVLSIEQGRIQRGAWGVVMWEEVDPTIDFFSVFVGGLTNAHRWTDAPDRFQLGDPPGKGREFVQKTLQLNFWRPGDQYEESEREIRFGVPEDRGALYDSGEGVAYRWVFR